MSKNRSLNKKEYKQRSGFIMKHTQQDLMHDGNWNGKEGR